MSERFKEKIVVSAEVKTYLKDLYNQIEYELREDYEDALEEAINKIDKAIKYIHDDMILDFYNDNIPIDIIAFKILKLLGDKE